MKKGWVIYSRETLSSKFGNNAFDWMKESALKYELEVNILFEEDFDLLTTCDSHVFYMNGIKMEKPDFAVMRSYGFDVARHLEEAGVPVFNKPLAMVKSQDKWQTHQILSGALVKSPEAYVSQSSKSFKEIARVIGQPFVVKGLLGSKGEDVHLVDDEASLKRALSELENQKVMYQKFISESSGTDIRVHVIGGEVVAAVRRRSDGDFKSNFHQGGSAESVDLTEEMTRISLSASKALNLDFAGIDLLESKNGPTVCEVNAIPGFRTICLTSETDIPSLIFFKYVKEELNKK